MNKNRGLVKRLRKKDESALEEIMKEYTRLISTIIYNIGRGTLSSGDIEEVTMDTFFTLWKNSDKVYEDTLQGYLCRIAKTKAFDKLDTIKKGIVVDISEIDIEDEFSLEGDIESRAVGDEICRIIEEINQPDREIVLRYYFYYQKISEISKITGINSGTVKTKLRRARKIIKEKLTERGYDL